MVGGGRSRRPGERLFGSRPGFVMMVVSLRIGGMEPELREAGCGSGAGGGSGSEPAMKETSNIEGFSCKSGEFVSASTF